MYTAVVKLILSHGSFDKCSKAGVLRNHRCTEFNSHSLEVILELMRLVGKLRVHFPPGNTAQKSRFEAFILYS